MPRIYRVEQNNKYENEGKRFSSPSKKNKKGFKFYKKNTVKSLNEVELFLRDFNKFTRYIKLYKILK